MANGQYTFTDMEYAARKRAPRKDEFLRQMDKIIPCAFRVRKSADVPESRKFFGPFRGVTAPILILNGSKWA